MSWGAAAPAVSVCGAPDPPACVGACGVSIVWDIVLRPVFVISVVLRAAAYGGGARLESACVAAPAVHAAAIATAGSFLDPAGLFCGARWRQMAKWPGAGAYARCDRTRQRPGSSLPSRMVGAGRGAASPARRVGGSVARGDWCGGGSAIWRGCSHGFVLWLLPAVPQVPSVFMPGTSYLLLPSTLHPRRPFPNSPFCRRPRDCDRGNGGSRQPCAESRPCRHPWPSRLPIPTQHWRVPAARRGRRRAAGRAARRGGRSAEDSDARSSPGWKGTAAAERHSPFARPAR